MKIDDRGVISPIAQACNQKHENNLRIEVANAPMGESKEVSLDASRRTGGRHGLWIKISISNAELCTIIEDALERYIQLSMERLEQIWALQLEAMRDAGMPLQAHCWLTSDPCALRTMTTAMPTEPDKNDRSNGRCGKGKGPNMVSHAVDRLGGVESAMAQLGVSRRAVYLWIANANMEGVAAGLVWRLAELSGIPAVLLLFGNRTSRRTGEKERQARGRELGLRKFGEDKEQQRDSKTSTKSTITSKRPAR